MLAGNSTFGNGMSVPLGRWPPASNCIEIETARRAPLGQNWPAAAASVLAAGGAALSLVLPGGAAGTLRTAPAARRPTPALARVRKFRRPAAADSFAVAGSGCFA